MRNPSARWDGLIFSWILCCAPVWAGSGAAPRATADKKIGSAVAPQAGLSSPAPLGPALIVAPGLGAEPAMAPSLAAPDIRGVELKHELMGHEDAVRWLQFSPDGKTLLSAGHDGQVRAWDVADGNSLGVAFHGSDIRSGAISPDGRIFTAGYDGLIREWSLDAERKLLSAGLGSSGEAGPPIWSLGLLAEGGLIAGRKNGRISLLIPGKEPRLLSQEGMPVLDVATSRDPRRFFTGSYDGARAWDIASGKARRLLPPNGAGIDPDMARALKASEDGARLFTGAANGLVYLWDTATGKMLRVFSDHASGIWTLARASGDLLLSAGDTTARLWDMATGRELLRLEHTRAVSAAAASPDGRRMATAARDNIVRLWQILP